MSPRIVRFAPAHAKKRDAVYIPIISCGSRRSYADNLGWQAVMTCFDRSPRIRVEPLFYEDGELIGMDGRPPAERFSSALVSLCSENDLGNLASIRALLGDVKLYGGGFAYSNVRPFADEFLDGGFTGEFDRFDEAVYDEAAASLAVDDRPSIFAPDIRYSPTVDRMAASAVILPESVFPGTFLLEINRGCPFSCRFCEVPSSRDERYLPFDAVLEAVGRARIPDVHRIGIVGTAIASHPDFTRIVRRLEDDGWGLSFSSLRADLLDEEAISLIARSGSVTLTIAPEAGSAAMKRAVRKNISVQTLKTTMRIALSHGIRRFKFYYLLGIPGETDADAAAIADELSAVVNEAKLEAKSRRWMPLITASVNPYIIKRWGADGEEHFVDRAAWVRRSKALGRALRQIGGVHLVCNDYNASRLEGILSFAPREAASIVREEPHAPPRRMAERILAVCDIPAYSAKDRVHAV